MSPEIEHLIFIIHAILADKDCHITVDWQNKLLSAEIDVKRQTAKIDLDNLLD